MMIGAIIGTIVIVLVTIAIGLLVDRKTPVLPRAEAPAAKPAHAHGAGLAPATALRVRPAQLDKLRDAQRCPHCRQSMRSEADEVVRYNDADLLVLHFACGSCAAKRTLYATTR